jgi:hypothetical protein
VLGVDPGSNSAEIEQAYRRLIKQHHPDREGGDASRAAEINRAYRELRSVRDLKDPLEFNLDWPDGAPLRPRVAPARRASRTGNGRPAVVPKSCGARNLVATYGHGAPSLGR